MKQVFVCAVLTSLAACGKSRSEPLVTPPAQERVAEKKPEPPPPDENALPANGMYCTINTRGYIWTADGKIVEPKLSHDLIVSSDGTLSEVDSELSPKHIEKLVGITNPKQAAVELPDDTKSVFRSKSGSVLALDEGKASVWRDGKWTQLAVTGADTLRFPYSANAIEHGGAWWIDQMGVYVEKSGALHAVKPPGGYESAGLLATGDDGYAFLGKGMGDYSLWIAKLGDGAIAGKPEKVGPLLGYPSDGKVASNPSGTWAVAHESGQVSGIYASVGAAKPKSLTNNAVGLLAVDGYDRVWYGSPEGLVVVGADGKEQLYPRSTGALFQVERDSKCVVLGKGLETLPPVGAQQMGTLALDISDGGNLEFAVCDELVGEKCQDSAKKITGTLDASGKWSKSVPIGKYESTVKINGEWLTAQIDMSQIGNTANWFCEVKPSETCTIQLRAK